MSAKKADFDIAGALASSWWRRVDEFEPLRVRFVPEMPEEMRLPAGDALGLLDAAYGSPIMESPSDDTTESKEAVIEE